MKTINLIYNLYVKQIKKILITGGLVAVLLMGWFIGSLYASENTEHQPTKLTHIAFNGETLPTIILKELLVTAKSEFTNFN